jgi:hypothetical protein
MVQSQIAKECGVDKRLRVRVSWSQILFWTSEPRKGDMLTPMTKPLYPCHPLTDKFRTSLMNFFTLVTLFLGFPFLLETTMEQNSKITVLILYTRVSKVGRPIHPHFIFESLI